MVASALEWLKLNHSDYCDLHIDNDALESYPVSGVPVTVVHRTPEGDSNVITAATSICNTEDEIGTDSGPCPFTVNGLVGARLESMSIAARKAAALQHLRTGGSVLAKAEHEYR
jgi:hypothetical protein